MISFDRFLRALSFSLITLMIGFILGAIVVYFYDYPPI